MRIQPGKVQHAAGQLGGQQCKRRRRQPHADTQQILHICNDIIRRGLVGPHQNIRTCATNSTRSTNGHLGTRPGVYCTNQHCRTEVNIGAARAGMVLCGPHCNTQWPRTRTPLQTRRVDLSRLRNLRPRNRPLIGTLKRQLFRNWRRSVHCGGSNQQIRLRQAGRLERHHGSQTQFHKCGVPQRMRRHWLTRAAASIADYATCLALFPVRCIAVVRGGVSRPRWSRPTMPTPSM